MSDPFVAEIRIFPFNFAPRGWAFCDGQLLPISQNTAVFSLLGTYYGGDGRSNFGLPNLQGSAPMHTGATTGPGLSSHVLGESGGSDNVTLISSEMPGHTHTLSAENDNPRSADPANHYLAFSAIPVYSDQAVNSASAPTATSPAGSSTPHNNLQPYLVLNFCIALQGVYPPRG